MDIDVIEVKDKPDTEYFGKFAIIGAGFCGLGVALPPLTATIEHLRIFCPLA